MTCVPDPETLCWGPVLVSVVGVSLSVSVGRGGGVVGVGLVVGLVVMDGAGVVVELAEAYAVLSKGLILTGSA